MSPVNKYLQRTPYPSATFISVSGKHHFPRASQLYFHSAARPQVMYNLKHTRACTQAAVQTRLEANHFRLSLQPDRLSAAAPPEILEGLLSPSQILLPKRKTAF